MVKLIGALTMMIVAIVIAARGIVLVVKAINVLIDEIQEGLNQRIRERRARRKIMNEKWT